MANRMTFDPSEGPSTEQQAAETAALEQGEKLIQAQTEDRDRRMAATDSEQEDVSLIGGKFKSQDDLLKAYNELQSKLGQPASEDEEEESEEPVEGSEEAPVEEAEEATEVTETVNYMHKLNEEFGSSGELSEEAIDKLSEMDTKDLIKAYMQYNSQATKVTLQQSEMDAIQQSVGGPEAYGEMTTWAASNLSESEIKDYNDVTNSGNPAAIRFAVAALNNRFREGNGYEAPLVSGKKAAGKSKVFRSQAELSRAISDPRYSTDPAYRMDVEEKLMRSGDLL